MQGEGVQIMKDFKSQSPETIWQPVKRLQNMKNIVQENRLSQFALAVASELSSRVANGEHVTVTQPQNY